MSLVFIGGARGAGKTTSVTKEISGIPPKIEHIALSIGVKEHAAQKGIFRQRTRELLPNVQTALTAQVVREAKDKSESKIVLLDGHYTSSYFVYPHDFFPCLREVAHLFDIFVLFERSADKIKAAHIQKGKKPRPEDVVRLEIAEEKKEAGYLKNLTGKALVTTAPEDFPHVLEQIGVLLPAYYFAGRE